MKSFYKLPDIQTIAFNYKNWNSESVLYGKVNEICRKLKLKPYITSSPLGSKFNVLIKD